MQVVLASTSPRRKMLLKGLVKNFKVIAPQFDEEEVIAQNPYNIALASAIFKADSVRALLKNKKCVIIGCDTIVVLKNKLLGKPLGEKNAYKMLKELSGKKHSVISGLCVFDEIHKKVYVDIEESFVYFKKLSEKEIIDYIKTGEPLDKAGAYAIQGKGRKFVKKYTGSYTNIVGLPVEKLKKILKKVKSDVNH